MFSLDLITIFDRPGLPAGVLARLMDHASLDEWPANLAPMDQARISRLQDTDKRLNLERSLLAIRQELSGLLGRPPADVFITHDAKGAPSLTNAPDTHISISRTEGWSALAMSTRSSIGIDIERIRPVEWAPMLQMVSTAEEARTLSGLNGHALDAFYRLWTAKEAIMKAAGEGFRMGARSIRIPDAMLTGDNSQSQISTALGVFDIYSTQHEDLMIALAVATA